MKKWIHATEDTGNIAENIKNNDDLIRFLQSQDIDTTMNKYELDYVLYKRSGQKHKALKFTCPGDYLALFAAKMCEAPNFNNITEWWDIEDFVEIVEENPTFADLYESGEYDEWDSPEECGHITLKNLTTNTVLVEDQDSEY